MFDDPFFGRSRTKEVRLRAKPIKVNVQPLPHKGKPTDFSGIVGSIEMGAKFSKRDLKVGESTTLTVYLKGQANLRAAELKFPAWEGIKTYPDSPKFQQGLSAAEFVSQKTFKVAIVPTQAGEYSLAPITFTYFDPKAMRYKTLTSGEVTLNIAPGEQSETVTDFANLSQPAKRRLKQLGEDIMPIERSSEALRSSSLQRWEIWLLVALTLLGPLLVILGETRKRRLSNQDQYLWAAKKQKALNRLTKELKAIQDSKEFYPKVSLAFRSYLGNRMGFEDLALSAVDVNRRRDLSILSEETLKRIAKILNTFEMGQYGGAEVDSSKMDEIKKEIIELSKRVEKESR
jgi:hypothetical protein